MMFRLQLTRYQGLHLHTEAPVEWTDTWQDLSPLQALEVIGYHCSGVLAEDTTATVTDQDTDRAVSDRELACLAFDHARMDPAQRPGFAAWLAARVHEFLWPWDDGAPIVDPPWSYWRDAACWTRRTLGHYLDTWLIDAVTRTHRGFRHALHRHDELVRSGHPTCGHRRHTPAL